MVDAELPADIPSELLAARDALAALDLLEAGDGAA